MNCTRDPAPIRAVPIVALLNGSRPASTAPSTSAATITIRYFPIQDQPCWPCGAAAPVPSIPIVSVSCRWARRRYPSRVLVAAVIVLLVAVVVMLALAAPLVVPFVVPLAAFLVGHHVVLVPDV